MRCLAILVIFVGTAHAQPVGDAQKAEADRLFEEGRELLAKGKRAEACDKFRLSTRKDPGAVGTLLNLGLCYETDGQVATSVRYYEEARDRAHDQKLSEHQAAAERKIALLATRVPHLQITGAPANARVIVDDIVISADQRASLPVDPGTRSIVVTAPDKLPYETKVTAKEGTVTPVAIPELRGATQLVEKSNARRTYGKVLVGSGVGLAVLGAAVGIYARSAYWNQFPAASMSGAVARDPMHDCWTVPTGTGVARECNAVGASKVRTARTLAHVSTGTLVTGGVAVATGLVLWWTAPKSELAQVSVLAGDGVTGLVYTGRF